MADVPNIRNVNPDKADKAAPAACALCGQPLGDEPTETASDGLIVHERCEAEYEDVIYHREREAGGDAP